MFQANQSFEQKDSAKSEQSGVYLKQYMGLFEKYLNDPDISEICVNKPGELWIEKAGEPEMLFIENKDITDDILWRLGRLVATKSDAFSYSTCSCHYSWKVWCER